MADVFEPTVEQGNVIEASGSALIVAGPGTGKTRTAIEKALRAIDEIEESSRRQVLFLSFSNATIYRLAESAKLHIPARSKRRLRFTTYHALAADILRRYGRFVGLPPRIRVVDKLEETLLALEDDWPDADHEYRDELLELARTRGLCAFDVLVPLATRLLESSPQLARILGRRFPLIIADEFQDTSQEQWDLLKAVGGSSAVVALGDPNQIIYSSLHTATQSRMNEFEDWKGVLRSKFSAKNFRCGSADILGFADCLLTGSPFSSASGGVACREIQYRSQLRSHLAAFWIRVRKNAGKNETIGVLTPSGPIAEDVAVALRSPPIGTPVSFPVHTRIARDDAAHDAVLLALAAIRDCVVAPGETKTRIAAIALHAMDLRWNSRKKRNIKKIEKTARLIEKELGKDSALAALAKEAVSAFRLEALAPAFIAAVAEHDEFKTATKRMAAHDRLRLEKVSARDPQLPLFDTLRQSREPKGLLGYDADPGTTHVINYHKAKGREFDYVAMVVDPRGESSKTPIEEARRLYYVCATRAKKGLLVLHYRNELGRVLGPVLRPASPGS